MTIREVASLFADEFSARVLTLPSLCACEHAKGASPQYQADRSVMSNVRRAPQFDDIIPHEARKLLEERVATARRRLLKAKPHHPKPHHKPHRKPEVTHSHRSKRRAHRLRRMGRIKIWDPSRVLT